MTVTVSVSRDIADKVQNKVIMDYFAQISLAWVTQALPVTRPLTDIGQVHGFNDLVQCYKQESVRHRVESAVDEMLVTSPNRASSGTTRSRQVLKSAAFH